MKLVNDAVEEFCEPFGGGGRLLAEPPEISGAAEALEKRAGDRSQPHRS